MLARVAFAIFGLSLFSVRSIAVEHERVSLEVYDCGSAVCATVVYVNKTSDNMCIGNGLLPFDGEVYERAFEVVDRATRSLS